MPSMRYPHIGRTCAAPTVRAHAAVARSYGGISHAVFANRNIKTSASDAESLGRRRIHRSLPLPQEVPDALGMRRSLATSPRLTRSPRSMRALWHLLFLYNFFRTNSVSTRARPQQLSLPLRLRAPFNRHLKGRPAPSSRLPCHRAGHLHVLRRRCTSALFVL